jgi:serine/threonine protein kinase
VTHLIKSTSQRSLPRCRRYSSSGSRKAESENDSESSASYDDNAQQSSIDVVARVSTHVLREERAYHICKSLTRSVDPDGNHIVRPLDMVRLASQQGDKGAIIACIFEDPGPNYLPKVVDYGPAWYNVRRQGDKLEAFQDELFEVGEPVSLQMFLDFAVGASECLEILHHGQQHIIHGEIRGDAFHMNKETGRVKVMNFGSGLRTFEQGLLSTGWSVLSTELGIKIKLQYMSPEQTGRMPAKPDGRTDIFSLGILFWTMLTQQEAFNGKTMDIVRGVLGRPLPLVSDIRLDVPDVIGRIINKATAKAVGERYHSASGLRHDLAEVRRLLGAGDSAAIKHWQIGTKDISPSFILPTTMIGRTAEHDMIVQVIEKVSRRHRISQKPEISRSSLSEARFARLDASLDTGDNSGEEDNTSSADGRTNSQVALEAAAAESGIYKANSSKPRSATVTQHNSINSQDPTRPGSNLKLALDLGSISEIINSESTGPISNTDGLGSLISRRNTTRKLRKKDGRCEIVSIAGAAGLGKSCLVQSVQVEARRRGYFASSKFEHAEKAPFGPVFKLLSSLFQQVFSESRIDPVFHQVLKQYVRPTWLILHKVLRLPEFLLGPRVTSHAANHFEEIKGLRGDLRRPRSSSSSSHSNYNMTLGAQSSQDFLRAGSSTKSMPLMNTFLDVLRIFTEHKFVCFCLEDLQFADDESLDLITQIVSSRMNIVIIVTYRPDEILQERIKRIVDPSSTENTGLHAPTL